MIPTTSFETRDLRVVQAIAEAGGVTRAARLLHLSQSAISHQLKDLEGRLGVALFERRGRGVHMTDAGRRVLELARQVLEPMARAESELKKNDRPARELRIATQCQTAYYWLPPVLGALSLSHPDVVLRIMVEATGDPVAALTNGELDLALCLGPPTDKRFQWSPLFEDELVAVVAPGHPFASRRYVEGSDLAEETLVLPDISTSMRKHVRRELFPEGRRRLGRVVRIPLTEVILELVKARHGISILPRWSVMGPVSRGELSAVRLNGRGLFRRWLAVHRRRCELKPAIMTLLGLLKREGAPRSVPVLAH